MRLSLYAHRKNKRAVYAFHEWDWGGGGEKGRLGWWGGGGALERQVLSAALGYTYPSHALPKLDGEIFCFIREGSEGRWDMERS